MPASRSRVSPGYPFISGDTKTDWFNTGLYHGNLSSMSRWIAWRKFTGTKTTGLWTLRLLMFPLTTPGLSPGTYKGTFVGSGTITWMVQPDLRHDLLEEALSMATSTDHFNPLDSAWPRIATATYMGSHSFCQMGDTAFSHGTNSKPLGPVSTEYLPQLWAGGGSLPSLHLRGRSLSPIAECGSFETALLVDCSGDRPATHSDSHVSAPVRIYYLRLTTRGSGFVG